MNGHTNYADESVNNSNQNLTQVDIFPNRYYYFSFTIVLSFENQPLSLYAVLNSECVICFDIADM